MTPENCYPYQFIKGLDLGQTVKQGLIQNMGCETGSCDQCKESLKEWYLAKRLGDKYQKPVNPNTKEPSA